MKNKELEKELYKLKQLKEFKCNNEIKYHEGKREGYSSAIFDVIALIDKFEGDDDESRKT